MAAVVLKKLGKYEILGTLGRGAMGIVYDGFDPVIERRVAIKTIAKESLDPGEAPELLARFKREAQAAGRLNHPCIVSIHDYGEDDGLAFIAMEYIKGKELRRYFDSQHRFPLAYIVRIMCDILDALDHAHRNGIVHRDIKPANIMITDEGRVKVADFGVAWIESSTMTQVGARIGTPAYMSPEQHQGFPVSGRSDIFSAGVILYQFLTGVRPFAGNGFPLIQQILLQQPLPPSALNFDIPPALDAVTMKALAKSPEDRFASAREFAEAFRQAATGESLDAAADLVLNDEALPIIGRDDTPIGSARGTAVANANTSGGSGWNVATVTLEFELEYWKEIKDSSDAADFETFLREFPASRFAPLARRRLRRLEAKADGPRAVEAAAGNEAAEPARNESESREDERTLALGQVGAAASALAADTEAAKVTAAVEDHANEAMPAICLEPTATAQAPSTPVGAAGYDGKNEPVHAPYREATSPSAQALPSTAARASRRSRRSSWLPIAALLALALVGGAAWHTTRLELDPLFAALQASADSIVSPLKKDKVAAQAPAHANEAVGEPQAQALQATEAVPVEAVPARPSTIAPDARQPPQASEAERTEQQRMPADAARQAEERRKNERALAAERERRLTPTRQKEETARGEASENYELATVLLEQGRNREAVRILRELALKGHGPAAKTLGDLYRNGDKVSADMQEAAFYYAVAERNGVKMDGPAFAYR